MDRDDLFHYFHRYNRLVRRNLAAPLLHSCGNEYYTSLDKNDEMILVCKYDGDEVVPGLATIDRVKAVVGRSDEQI